MSYEDTILGVWKVVNSNMNKAIRVVSVEKGLDVRDFSLIAFGGAGPVHAAALARELSIPRVIVPYAPGVFSAYGIMVSDVQLDYSRTKNLRVKGAEIKAEEFVKETLQDFTAEAERELVEQGIDFENFMSAICQYSYLFSYRFIPEQYDHTKVTLTNWQSLGLIAFDDFSVILPVPSVNG